MLDISDRGRPVRCSGGFTLIELLVAIAVIGVLAAILFPVFAQAREKACQSSCAANLKNLGAAILMYTQDYDEQLPLAAYATSASGFLEWHDLTDPYVKNQQIWWCPSSQVRRLDQNGKPTTHFGYNAHYLTTIATDFSNAATHHAVSLAAVPSPAETVLLTDAKASISPSWCGDDGKYLLAPSQAPVDCWGRPNYLHSDGASVLWLDGHTHWRKPDQFYAGQVPPDRYFDAQ